MAESDLDYAKVIGRFSLDAGDGPDEGEKPDIIYCDEGTIELAPLTTFTKVVGGTPVPFTAGNAVIVCQISQGTTPDGPNYYAGGAGYLLYRGQPYVWVIDLTSDKVNPVIGPDLATHAVTFKNVKAAGTAVGFPPATVRLTGEGDGFSPGSANDLTRRMPATSGAATPIFQGPQGVGIVGASIVDGTNLEIELDDSTTIDAGELPVGPGGSDPGVAGYLASASSETSEQTGAAALDPDHPLGAAIAELIDALTEAP